MLDKTISFIRRHQKPIENSSLIISLVFLLLVVVYTAYKTAIMNFNNADALVDNYMFSDWHTFHQASFAAAHTQMLKWPLFALMEAFGHFKTTVIAGTIAFAIVPYAAFTWVLYKTAGRRWLPVLTLILASVIVLTPLQVQSTWLPVNLAMLTTRNLEYALYILYIYLALKGMRGSKWSFAWSIFILAILGASDKFFVLITPAAAVLLAIAGYVKTQDFRKVRREGNFLLNAVLGFICAEILLLVVAKSGLTHISSPTDVAPFTFVSSMTQLINGFIGAIQDTLVNFGAFFLGFPAKAKVAPLLFNAVVAVASLSIMYRLFLRKREGLKNDDTYNFGAILTMASVASVIVFVLSDHQFTVDARYIYLLVFAGFFALAYELRKHKIQPEVLTGLWVVLLLVSLVSFRVAKPIINSTISNAQMAMQDRFTKAGSTLQAYHTNVLVGDYWSVVPTKYYAPQTITQSSVVSCNHRAPVLTSGTWYKSTTNTHSALYLLRDGDKDTFNNGCSSDQLQKIYGTPDSQEIIRDNNGKPLDILWLYGHDIRSNIVE